MARDYISASSINLFLTCPTSYFLKYSLDFDSNLTDLTYAKFGTLVHNICENMANGKYLFVEEAIEEYENGFSDTGIGYDKYYEEGLEGIKRHWEFVEDFTIDIVGAEVEFKVKPFEDILPFFGFIDLVYRDSNGKLIVRDFKTSKPYTNKQLSHQIQPYFYSEACLAIYGELPSYFEFDFVRYGETHTIVTNKEFLEFNRLRFKGIWKQIQNQEWKATGEDYFCTHFCQNRALCEKFNSKG